MGRHIDPDILKFIETYKKKGESWGFKAKDEHKLLKGVYYVDLIWTPYEEEHETFVTFEIEKNGKRALDNLSKLLHTSATSIEKPYQHYVIIFDCKLSRSKREIISQVATNYNLHLFENIKNDDLEKKRLDQELERLKIDLSKLISRKGKYESSETVIETIKGLKEFTPVLKVGVKAYQIEKATITSGSKLISDHTSKLPIKNVFNSKKYQEFALIGIPKKVLLMSIPNSPIAIDVYVTSKKIKNKVFLKIESCNDPIVLNFELENEGGGNFNLKIDPLESDVSQLKLFNDIMLTLMKKKAVNLFNKKHKVVGRFEGLKSKIKLPSGDWFKGLEALDNIQRKTNTRIPSPKDVKLYPEDFKSINKITEIITKGELTLILNEITITITKKVIMDILRTQQKIGFISNMTLNHTNIVEKLLETDIQLGPYSMNLPKMILLEKIEDLKHRIKELSLNDQASLKLIPISNKKSKIVYSDWKND